jgi:hypothetical protein
VIRQEMGIDMTDLGDVAERSNDEIQQLLWKVLSEPQPALTTPAIAPTRPESISEGKALELSLDEILEKIQRDIVEGQSVPLALLPFDEIEHLELRV